MSILAREQQVVVVSWLIRGVSNHFIRRMVGVSRAAIASLKRRWKAGEIPDITADAAVVASTPRALTPPPPHRRLEKPMLLRLAARLAELPVLPRATGRRRGNNVLAHHLQVAVIVWIIHGMGKRWIAIEVGIHSLTVARLRRRWQAGEVPDLDEAARAIIDDCQIEEPVVEAPVDPAPLRLPRGFVEWERRFVPLRTLCEERGLPVGTVQNRLARGASLAEALRTEHKLVGAMFGRYKVLAVTRGRTPVATCKCACGAVKKVRVAHLRPHRRGRPATFSCGCHHLEQISGGAAPTHVDVFGERMSMGELGVLAGKRPASIWAAMRRGLTPEEAAFGASR